MEKVDTPQSTLHANYQKKVDVITFTRLLFNNNDDFGEFLGHNLKNNSHKMIKGINPKLIFKAMSQIVTEQTMGEIDLDTFLNEYECASSYFNQYLKRSYMLDLHKYDPSSPVHCKKRDRIFAFLDYCYAYEDSAKEKVEMFFSGKRNWITDIYDVEKGEEKVPAYLILLLLLGIIPEYTNKKGGDVEDIFDDMNRLFDFFRVYARQSAAGAMFGDTPLLTRIENERRKERQINWQNNGLDSEESSVLNRMKLIYITQDFLNLVHGFSNNRNLTQLNRSIEYFYPDLEGIWVESEVGSTNFWRFMRIDNGYFLFSYKITKDAEGKGKLKIVRYEFYLYREVSGEEMAFVAHPSYMRQMLDAKSGPEILARYKNWSYVFLSSDKTKLCRATNDYDVPTLIELAPTNINNWFKLQKLYRVEDSEYYEKLLDLPIEDEYHQDYYEFKKLLWAITYDYLYLELDKDAKEYFCCDSDNCPRILMKVPKRINASLYYIRMYDDVGLASFADQSYYFGVANSNFFVKVSTQEQRQELGIVFTSCVDE